MKDREARLKVNIPARMRAGVEWADLRIENLSSRGLMIKSKTDLKVGTYVEVLHGDLIIVGRIVWTKGGNCGLRSQDVIDATAMLCEAKRKSALAAAASKTQPTERRNEERCAAMRGIRDRAERSRSFARMSQFVVIGTSAAAGCGLVAVTVSHFLRDVLGAISAALGG